MVDGINECATVIVGVGSSGVGEGDIVAVDRSAGVEEADTTAMSSVAVAGTGSAVWFTVVPGMLHASMTNIRIKLNAIMELFFFMGSLLATNYHSFWYSNQ
jgi:hypothetical protein